MHKCTFAKGPEILTLKLDRYCVLAALGAGAGGGGDGGGSRGGVKGGSELSSL